MVVFGDVVAGLGPIMKQVLAGQNFGQFIRFLDSNLAKHEDGLKFFFFRLRLSRLGLNFFKQKICMMFCMIEVKPHVFLAKKLFQFWCDGFCKIMKYVWMLEF